MQKKYTSYLMMCQAPTTHPDNVSSCFTVYINERGWR